MGSVTSIELLIDRSEMVLHRLLADVEAFRHFRRRAAVCDVLQHLFFTLGDDAGLLGLIFLAANLGQHRGCQSG